MGLKLRQTAVGAETGSRRISGWSIAGRVFVVFVAGIGAVLIGAAGWIRRTFGPISIDQMLMHLPGAGGAETTGAESGYIDTFVWQSLVLPLGIVLIVFIAAIAVSRRRGPVKPYAVPPKKTKLRRALETAVAKIRLRRWAPSVLSIATLAVGATLLIQTVSLPQYVASFSAALTIDDYYASPTEQTSTELASAESAATEDLSNLVVIYLESGEAAFSDESLFEINMYAPLEAATSSWASFDNLSKYEGGGWTMAGIVGTECGIPLRGPGLGEVPGGEIGEGNREYLSVTKCMGDVLADAGYHSVFMGGADANFASKGTYLRSHGYDEVLDLGHWESLGETERSIWGLSDRRLMENAKQEVTRLHEAGDPFHLSLLTVDSHEPATLFDGCPAQTVEPMASVIFCSMDQVADFVEYMSDQGYLEDTAVLITGDHPKQFGEVGIFMDELSTLDSHPLFNRLWVPGGVTIMRSEIDQLSVAATVLDALGLGRVDGRAGLGFSALRAVNSSSGAVSLSAEDYQTVLSSRSGDFYTRAWGLLPEESPEFEAASPNN